MPRAKLWCFVVGEDSRIYVRLGESVLKKYGAVLKIKCATKEDQDKPDHIRVLFSDSDKPRQLSLDTFSWDANDLSRKFRGCQSSVGFVARWEENISGNLSESGVFSQPMNNPVSGSTTDINTSVESVTSQSLVEPPPDSQLSTPTPQRKRSANPSPLVPASKQARLEQDSPSCSQTFEEEDMDKQIKSMFIGYYMLPVRSLQEPPRELLVRDRNPQMVSLLKQEMLSNPFGDVQPILCIVQLKENEPFDSKLKEAYFYLTIGGNHSRQALQELLQERPLLQKNRQYTHRLCAVYKPMAHHLARRLASKHNQAAAYCHEMTTWDWVVQCRKLLYEMANASMDKEPPTKPEGWKKACASVLALTVGQLDERMIFFLSTLPNNTFSLVSNVFKLYSEGQLKDQSVPRSKKGVKAFPDLKGSTFKPFRGIEAESVHQLMHELSECQISLKEAAVLCGDIKQLNRIQLSFTKITNCKNWSEAQEKFPQFTTAGMLEPFKKLSFTETTVPEQFMRFCKEALTTKERGEMPNVHDNIFWVCKGHTYGVLWKINTADIDPESLQQGIFSGSEHMCNFNGFQLSIFDVQFGKNSCAMDSRQLALLARALNYNSGLQNFTVVIITELKEVSKIAEELEDAGADSLQIAVCGLMSRQKGNKATGGSKLDERTVGVVVLRFGNPAPLNHYHENFFSYEIDPPVIDDATGKPVNQFQKPLKFMSELVCLYSAPGDWILDGLGGTSTTLIASINSGRHCISVESSSLQYIWAKVRAVKAINPLTTDKNDEEKNEAEDGKEDKMEAEAGSEEKSEDEAGKKDADD